jgi:hypothetical protein
VSRIFLIIPSPVECLLQALDRIFFDIFPIDFQQFVRAFGETGEESAPHCERQDREYRIRPAMLIDFTHQSSSGLQFLFISLRILHFRSKIRLDTVRTMLRAACG